MIDSHSHLDDAAYDSDRLDVIKRALDAGVTSMISIGCDLETSRGALKLADEHKMIHATVGVHPHEVKDMTDVTYPELKKLASHPKVVGYGEIGLDFHYNHSPRETQLEHFRRQIRLALELQLPMVIHSREAKEETLAILKGEGAGSIGGVLHCFTGDLEMAEAAIAMNFYISFSGVITFSNAGKLREVAKNLPPQKLMVETDCPYLSPVPHRGKRNEPAHVQHVLKALAELHPSKTLDEMDRITSENTSRVFKLQL